MDATSESITTRTPASLWELVCAADSLKMRVLDGAIAYAERCHQQSALFDSGDRKESEEVCAVM
jgi:hypothetical protein